MYFLLLFFFTFFEVWGKGRPLLLLLTKREQPALQADREPRPFESLRAGKRTGSLSRERAACANEFYYIIKYIIILIYIYNNIINIEYSISIYKQ